MTRREEVESCIINTLFECTHSGEDDTISDNEFAKVLAEKFINYETDLLKEFVEWYKEELKVESNNWIHYFAEKNARLENKVEPAKIKSLNAFTNGKEQGFDDVIDNIDDYLEKFLEDKNE